MKTFKTFLLISLLAMLFWSCTQLPYTPLITSTVTTLPADLETATSTSTPSPTSTLSVTSTIVPINFYPPPPGLLYRDMSGLVLVDKYGNQNLLWEGPLSDDVSDIVSLSPSGKYVLRHNPVGSEIIYDIQSGEEINLIPPEGSLYCDIHWLKSSNDLLLAEVMPQSMADGFACITYPAILDVNGIILKILGSEPTFNNIIEDSPTGDAIAFNQGRTPWIFYWGEEPHEFQTELYGFPDLSNRYISHPSWSPSGSKLAWVVHGEIEGEDVQGIGIFDLENQSSRLLYPYEIEGADGGRAFLFWSPDEEYIVIDYVYIEYRWIISIENEDAYKVDVRPIWDPDGNQYAYIAYSPEFLAFKLIIEKPGGIRVNEIEINEDFPELHTVGGSGSVIWKMGSDFIYIVFKSWNEGISNWLVNTITWESAKIDLPNGAFVIDWLSE